MRARNDVLCREKRWVEEALEATAPGLRERLGGDEGIVDSHVGVGNISGYLCRRSEGGPSLICDRIHFTAILPNSSCRPPPHILTPPAL